MAGILAALRITGQRLCRAADRLRRRRAAGVGIGRLVGHGDARGVPTIRPRSTPPRSSSIAKACCTRAARSPIRTNVPFAWMTRRWPTTASARTGAYDLLEVVRHVGPTVLVGTTAQPGTFSEEIVREMARHVERPVILPLSNPTSKVECTPAEAIRWTEGRAIVATGTAFDPVVYEGKTPRHRPGEQRLHLSRHGAGLHPFGRPRGDRLAVPRRRPRLAGCVGQERLDAGAIYPDQDELRNVAARVATAVIGQVERQQGGQPDRRELIEQTVREGMWWPEYQTYL